MTKGKIAAREDFETWSWPSDTDWLPSPALKHNVLTKFIK